NRPIGRKENGGKTALPIWGYFMKELLGDAPQKRYPVPKDITRKTLFTFTGKPEDEFGMQAVTEPIYAPLGDKMLLVCPLDPPEVLTVNVAVTQAGPDDGQPTEGAPVGATYPPVTRGGRPEQLPPAAPWPRDPVYRKSTSPEGLPANPPLPPGPGPRPPDYRR
ncbi:hypothetical protein ACFL2Q_12035, partial [Thermodesulfobacteriota bacterium]